MWTGNSEGVRVTADRHCNLPRVPPNDCREQGSALVIKKRRDTLRALVTYFIDTRELRDFLENVVDDLRATFNRDFEHCIDEQSNVRLLDMTDLADCLLERSRATLGTPPRSVLVANSMHGSRIPFGMHLERYFDLRRPQFEDVWPLELLIINQP